MLNAIFCDLLITGIVVYIPIHLIVRIQIRWTQKLALACSLCLTLVMIIITVIRASGIQWHNKLDFIWEVYWQTMAAEIGLILTAVSAFRTLFVARVKERRKRSTEGKTSLWTRSKGLFMRLLSPLTWHSKSSSARSGGSGRKEVDDAVGFPSIPGGTMTGIRTFINGQGRATTRSSHLMQSRAITEEDDGWLPLSQNVRNEHHG